MIPIIEKLLSAEQIAVRRLAVEVLGKIGDATALPPLIETLKNEDSRLRRYAALAIAAIGEKNKAVLAALDKAAADDDEWVRIYARHARHSLR